MRIYLNYIAVGLLGLGAVAGHAAPPGLSITPEDLKNLRTTSVLSKPDKDESNTWPTQPRGPTLDSDFGREFRKALVNEEKAHQAALEQQSTRDHLERINGAARRSNEAPRRLGQPEIQGGSVGISFGTNGPTVKSCRENEFGKTQCEARELR